MSTPPLPDALRRAVASDLTPVTPLHPVWRRTVTVAVVAAAVLAAALATSRLRGDLGELPMWLAWGATLVQLGVGVVLAGLALREAVPGRALPLAGVWAALAVGLALNLALGVATWVASPGPQFSWTGFSSGMTCMRHDLAFALPAFAATIWLAFRALPLRPAVAGLLGGAGAGITADAVGHLLCPMSDLRHVLVWHTGAIVAMAVAGFVVGVALSAVLGRR